MATHLQELLQRICLKSEWNYAIFWKLNHHSPMVLTWEDGYRNNNLKHDPSKSKRLANGQFDHDSLGVAMEKMYCHVYSLGEGIVGEVAVTGKHQWIFASDYMVDPCLPLEVCDEWQGQFSAGIKTIVVADVPHGVVQLGSLNEVKEDFKLLTLIRDLFSSLQHSLAYHDQNPIQYNLPNVLDFSTRNFSRAMNDFNHRKSDDYGFMVQKKAAIVPEFNHSDHIKSSIMFSGGSELHEALGPAFVQQHCRFSRDGENLQMPEITESSHLTSDSSSDHLLEAVVANFCRKNVTVESGVSFSTSESMLTTEKIQEPSINMGPTIGLSGYSIGCYSILEENKKKSNKKRARATENPRPRPRDRQLIQDRIKELRELVPNGSKGSIDSLLERTIKHMAFMESVTTRHADNLSNCATSRGCSKEKGVSRSGYEQGSSWAVEVGGRMKICPILVENLSVNGQMLIEMLCEDCDSLMEIAEAIRNLGLTILKGITDNHGDKTWMRFIVEGQSNRNLHRIDVLWSLVQLLESKATA